MTAERGCHRSEPAHQVGELLWADRLGAIAQRLLRLDVHIDQKRVRADRDRGKRQRFDQFWPATGMAGIHDDG